MTIPAEIPDLNYHPQRRNSPTWRYVAIAAAIIVFGLLLQIQCMSKNYEKVIDDFQLIYNVGPQGDRGCSDDPAGCFHHPVFGLYYRPLFTATFALQDRLLKRPGLSDPYQFARGTQSYHLENLILHAAVCGLAFWFFYLLFRKEFPALLAGLILTLHPLQVSVTTFIGGRPDSMALFFLLLFAIGVLNFAQIRDSRWSISSRLGWFFLSLLGYTCAVFTKEQCILMLLTLPLLLLHGKGVSNSTPTTLSNPNAPVPYVPEPNVTLFARKNRPWLLLNLLYLVPILLYANAAHKIVPKDAIPDPHWSTMLHIEMVGRTLCYFERLLLVPTVGPIHQSTLGPWDVPQPIVACGGYLVALLWLATLWRVRHNPALRFCALWTTLTLFPVLNLVPIPSQFASCYRAVIPLLGFAGLLGAALDRIFSRWQSHVPKASRLQNDQDDPLDPALAHRQPPVPLWHNGPVWAVLLILLAFYSWETVADVQTWQNGQTLMFAELYGDPNFAPSFGGLGFWEEGSATHAANWKEAEAQFGIVIDRVLPKLQPGQSFEAALDSAACQRNLWSQSGLRYTPRGYLHILLPHRGWARQQQGHYAAAEEDYRLALLVSPWDTNSRANLYTCYLANGQVDEAAGLYSSPAIVPARSDSNR